MDNSTLSILQIFKNRTSLTLSQLSAILNIDALTLSDSIAYMRNLDYIEISGSYRLLHGDDLTVDAPLEVTHLGLIAIEQELKSRKRFKYVEFRAWVTLVIAVAAFIKSFFF